MSRNEINTTKSLTKVAREAMMKIISQIIKKIDNKIDNKIDINAMTIRTVVSTVAIDAVATSTSQTTLTNSPISENTILMICFSMKQ